MGSEDLRLRETPGQNFLMDVAVQIELKLKIQRRIVCNLPDKWLPKEMAINVEHKSFKL